MFALAATWLLVAPVAPVQAAAPAGAEEYVALEDAREMSQTAKNLTRITFTDQNDAPDVSPDGKEIVFEHREGSSTNLYRVSTVGGTGAIRVTNEAVTDVSPRWSADGRSIFFSSNRVGGWRIWEIASNALGGVVMVSPGASTEVLPDVNRDGLVLFTGHTWMAAEGAWSPSYLWTVRPDGTRLTMVRRGYAGRWSPDGKRWVFQMPDQSGADQLYVSNADGSAATQITNGNSQHRRPTWSPDGKWIAYQDDKAGSFDIWLLHPDGTAPTQLTTNGSYDGSPSWARDGRIFFVSNRGKHWDIWRMEPILAQGN